MRSLTHHGPHRRTDRGAAAVEFALVVPVFLALLFGVISYGMMLTVRQGISQATAEGSRVYAVSPAGTPDLRGSALLATNNAISSYGVKCTDAGALVKGSTSVGTCNVPASSATCTGTGATGQCATVQIVYNYRANPLVPAFPGLGISLPETLTFKSTVRVNS